MDTTQIVLSSEEEANAVLAEMKDLLNAYEIVSMADLLDLVGLFSVFTDQNVGWTKLDEVKVKAVKDGFVLDLPPTEPLDR